MKEKKIIFHNAKEERPTESGHYLCLKNGFFQHVNYSKKWDLFNALDIHPTRKIARRTAIDVEFWADVTDVIDELRGTDE